MNQPDLFTLYRKSSPDTSREAAAYVHPKLTRLQALVMDWAKGAGRFTDKDLVREMQRQHGGEPSTWRTRRSELRDAGLIVQTGKIADGQGKRHTCWMYKP